MTTPSRTFTACLPAAVLALAVAGCGPKASDTSDTAILADTGAAEEMFERYVASINAGDTAKAAALYDTSDGFHWVERGGVQYASGAEAAASLQENFPAGSRIEMKVDETKVANMGRNAALLSAHYTFTALSEDGAAQFSFDGWMTVGMVKRDDGWRIAGGQTGPGKSSTRQAGN